MAGPIFIIPPDHPKHIEVKDEFEENWESRNDRPKVVSIARLIWREEDYSGFEDYAENIELRGRFHGRKNKAGMPMKRGNEKQLYHGMTSSCQIGSRTVKTCRNKDCYLCHTIENGFGRYEMKTGQPSSFGTQIFASYSSTRAFEALPSNSSIKVVSSCRVIIGRPLDTSDPLRFQCPPAEYDSIYGKPNAESRELEFVVYNPDAIRIEYLIFFTVQTS
ncbi:hypothetical protein RhiJN_23960 [Ceratobasidium sp. AG-Ba]|nr:hypothetical protein RhiJN_23960 [Ceratobasidium sp. AG-Ba]